MGVIEQIKRLKREKNALILAHYYVSGDIQDLADFVGDSLELARKAKDTEAQIIVMCGVYFMAETVKILNPEKKVLIPYRAAGCLMADMAIEEELLSFKQNHPQYKVVAYVNTSASVKALSDICCTSANAVEVVKSLGDAPVLFLPDKNLGSYVKETLKKDNILLWDGYCPVHQKVPLESVLKKKESLKAKLAVHPECPPNIRKHADFVGSTSQIISYASKLEKNATLIVATEEGIIHALRKKRPDVEFVPAYEFFICDQMKMITLSRLLDCLEHEKYEVFVSREVAKKAVSAIEKMLKTHRRNNA